MFLTLVCAGKVGDWKNYLDNKQAEEFDASFNKLLMTNKFNFTYTLPWCDSMDRSLDLRLEDLSGKYTSSGSQVQLTIPTLSRLTADWILLNNLKKIKTEKSNVVLDHNDVFICISNLWNICCMKLALLLHTPLNYNHINSQAPKATSTVAHECIVDPR